MVPKSKEKMEDQQQRNYELVLLINPDVTDEAFSATTDSVSKFVTEHGGTITNVEQWGKRKLAYPIQHFMEGNYVLTQFKLQPSLSQEFEASLQISEEVLRHLLIKLSS